MNSYLIALLGAVVGSGSTLLGVALRHRWRSHQSASFLEPNLPLTQPQQDALQRAMTPGGKRLVVSGPPGMGKSEAITQLVQRILDARGSGKTLLISSTSPTLTADLHGSLVELASNEDAVTASGALSAGLEDLFRALGPPPDGLCEFQPQIGSGGGTER
ncbi:hypothetical protein GCM10010214_12370 [Streptomyces abikoensis]|nr:hypothetical protein GCM10010214_12370 [Streptomyces abikoensis]